MFAHGDLDAAKGMLSDDWTLDRFSSVHLASPLTWTEDPCNDPYWRFQFYGLRPLQDLLYAFYDTADSAYRDKLFEILRSYLASAWRSPYLTTNVDLHAAAWRAMVLTNVYVKLDRSGDLPSDLKSSLYTEIEREGAFLANPANFQASFNHGMNQAAALLLVATNFPTLPEAPAWRDLAFSRLTSLMSDVIDPDGVEVENSPYYQYYVLDTIEGILGWASRNAIAIPSDIPSAAQRAIRYAADIVMPNGHTPMLGASIDLDASTYDPAVMATLDDAFPMLAYATSKGAAGTPPDRAVLFPTSGLSVLRSELAKGEALADQTYVSFDTGGWRNLHNQLDGLSLTMYGGGEVVLPDSGLYKYAPEGDHSYYASDYFYSTAAHNTVVVNGVNQDSAAQAGSGQTIASIDGWSYQSGWLKPTGDVTQRRAVLVLSENEVLVIDELSGSNDDTYAQTWHLAPDLALRGAGLDAFGVDGSGNAVLAIRQGLADGLSVSSSTDGTATSWYSSAYGSKVANPVVAYGSAGVSHTYVTLLTSGSLARADTSIAATTAGDEVSANICLAGSPTNVSVNALAQSGEQVSVSKTGGSCPATSAPTAISVTSPGSNQAATGMTTLAAKTSGPAPIDHVDFAIDGKTVGSARGEPYQVGWDSTSVADGTLVAVTATAYDTSGLATTSMAKSLVVSNAKPQTGKTVVSITFDDSLANQYVVEPMLTAHGMHATFYVITDSIGVSGHLSLAQLKQLAADGDEIGSHTVDHVRLQTVPVDEQLRQLCNSRNRLLALGFPVTTFAYPFSNYGDIAKSSVRACGYNGARRPGLGGDNPSAGPLVPTDPYEIPAVQSFSSDTTLADMEAAVTSAENSGGGWVPLVFHSVCLDACRSNAVSPNVLAAFIDWLAARGDAGTSVRTMAQVLGGSVSPPISAPAPLSFGSSANMLANPSLDSGDPLVPGNPSCWTPITRREIVSALPTVDGSLQMISDAHSGSSAVRLTINSVKDPSRAELRLMTPQDEGECSPQGSPGSRYTVGVWYRSNVPVTLSMTYRDADGEWHLLGQSPAFSASTAWTPATWTTDALPAGATNVAVRVSIYAVGSATVDDFSLARAGG